MTEKHIERLVKLRRELHRNAELSGNENRTAEIIRGFLESTGPVSITGGLGGNGLFAVYGENSKGPAILIRCELDALPIPEENDFAWRSGNDSVSHKCGHDGHMTMVCGVALALGEMDKIPAKIVLLFQPSEETGKGARRVLDDPGFRDIDPDYVFALHNLPGFPAGDIVLRKNTFAAASVGVIVRLKGESSHAAHPEEGKSPALAAAHIIQHLSAAPQFYTSMDDEAKVTVIHTRVGEKAFGTSPGYGEVMATLRTYNDRTLDALKDIVAGIVLKTAESFGLDGEIEWVEPFPATVNDPGSVDTINNAAEELGYSIIHKKTPFGWSEDFGHFTRNFKGAMFGLGSGENHPPLHAPDYDFPDELIPSGTRMFLEITEQLTAD